MNTEDTKLPVRSGHEASPATEPLPTTLPEDDKQSDLDVPGGKGIIKPDLTTNTPGQTE